MRRESRPLDFTPIKYLQPFFSIPPTRWMPVPSHPILFYHILYFTTASRRYYWLLSMTFLFTRLIAHSSSQTNSTAARAIRQVALIIWSIDMPYFNYFDIKFWLSLYFSPIFIPLFCHYFDILLYSWLNFTGVSCFELHSDLYCRNVSWIHDPTGGTKSVLFGCLWWKLNGKQKENM